MPAKYTQRQFVNGAHYHIFNRGVEKRKIFLDQQDFHIFKYYLFIYLAPPELVLQKYPQLPNRLRQKSLYQHINLEAYCLMPNHFHLLAQQTASNSVAQLLKQLTNAYTLYFNQKYQRVGGLMQGVYRATCIDSSDALIHVSRYIHRNPVEAGLVRRCGTYPWSSYQVYAEGGLNPILYTHSIMTSFSSPTSYAKFTESSNASTEPILSHDILIDDDRGLTSIRGETPKLTDGDRQISTINPSAGPEAVSADALAGQY